MTLLNRITDLYPIWLILTACLAFFQPTTLSWFTGNWINLALMTVMLSMGFTLTADDFRRLIRMPGSVLFGFMAQYTIMPLTAWGVAMALKLEPGFAVGLILLGSCPGGTASNVVTYLARGDVALSVTLTMVSTLLAFIFTPFWCQVLAGQLVPVNAWGLCVSTLQVIVLPVVAGVAVNRLLPQLVSRVVWLAPSLSVLAICMITGGIVAQSAAAMASHAIVLMTAVLALHGIGYLVGYAITRLFGYSEIIARTVSIEVGMQNSGMAAMLAKTHFPTHPMAAVPAVFSAITQNVMGSIIAAYWRFHPGNDASTSNTPTALSSAGDATSDSGPNATPTISSTTSVDHPKQQTASASTGIND